MIYNEMVCADTIRKANYNIDRLVETYPELKNEIEDIKMVERRIESQKVADKLVNDFINTIDKVVVNNGMDSNVSWSYYINGKIIYVDAEKLDTSTVFVKKYIKTMNILPPDFNKNEWRLFLELLQPKIIDKRGFK